MSKLFDSGLLVLGQLQRKTRYSAFQCVGYSLPNIDMFLDGRLLSVTFDLLFKGKGPGTHTE